MNKYLKQYQEILSNPLLEEHEKLGLLKDILLREEYDASLLINTSEKISDLTQHFLTNSQNKVVTNVLIKSGFMSLDHLFAGFQLGELVVIGARPSMGKTQFMVNLALHFSDKFPVQYFTFDLSKSALTNRFISCETGISMQDLMLQEFTTLESEKLINCAKAFEQNKVFINDDIQESLTTFLSICIEMIKTKGVKVIMIDYLQLMSTNRHRGNREQEISLISRELKKLARNYHVCVIATSQLSRSVETRGGDKRPILSDLRESGAIEQDADKLIFLYRPEYYKITEDENGDTTIGLMEVIVAKNRIGKLGSVMLTVNENFTSFSDSADNFAIDFPLDRLPDFK